MFASRHSGTTCGGSHSIMRRRVLVADDFEDTRRLTKLILEKNGFEVEEASDGYEAVKKAVKHPPDIILMDLAMTAKSPPLWTVIQCFFFLMKRNGKAKMNPTSRAVAIAPPPDSIGFLANEASAVLMSV